MRGLGKMVKRYISYHLHEGWRVGCSLFFLAAQEFFSFILLLSILVSFLLLFCLLEIVLFIMSFDIYLSNKLKSGWLSWDLPCLVCLSCSLCCPPSGSSTCTKMISIIITYFDKMFNTLNVGLSISFSKP